MKAAELRELTLEELVAEQKRLLRDHLNLRFQRTVDRLPKHHLIKETKRDIARVKTIMREREKNTNGGS